MISRVAGSCFWLNRYIERAEVLARMLGVNVAFQLDASLAGADCWRPLVMVTGEEPRFLEQTPVDLQDDPDTVQEYLCWNEDNPSSLYSSVGSARENARTIRETISLEMWEVLNDLWVFLNDKGARRSFARDRQRFYLDVRNRCVLFHGIAHETMLHEDPFEFMRLGTALERTGQTARLLDIKHHSIGPTESGLETPFETAQWLATLRFCSGVEPFLKREDKPFSGRAVADFLLFDKAFPRSVVHNLERVRNFLTLVRPPEPSSVGQRSYGRIIAALEDLEGRTIDDVLEEGLHEVVTRVVDTTIEVGAALHEEFFDPPSTSEQLQVQGRPQGQSQSQEQASPQVG